MSNVRTGIEDAYLPASEDAFVSKVRTGLEDARLPAPEDAGAIGLIIVSNVRTGLKRDVMRRKKFL